MSNNEKTPENDSNVAVPQTSPVEAEAHKPFVSIVNERLDEFEAILKEVRDGTAWTKRGIFAAIVITIATAITLSLGQWIGPVGVIVVIFLIGVIVIVIFIVILHHQRRSKAPDAPL